MGDGWDNRSLSDLALQAEEAHAAGRPRSHAQLEAEADRQVAAAETAEDLLRLALPSVSHDASCGVIGAKPLLHKIHRYLKDAT